MAAHEETLLFLVDVSVHGAEALRELDDDFAAMEDRRSAHITRLQQAASSPGFDLNASPVVPSSAPASTASQTEIVGIRGRQNPGSRMNPIITAEESGPASGLGSLAAASAAPAASSGGGNQGGAPNVAAAVPTPSPQVTPQQGEWLSDAAERVAQKVVAPQNDQVDDRMVQALQSVAQMNRNLGTNPVLDAANAVRDTQSSEVGDAAALLQRRRGGATGSHGVPDLAAAARQVQSTAEPSRNDLAQQLATIMASRVPVVPEPAKLNTGDVAARLNRPRSQVRELAATGALPGATKNERGEWVIPEDAIDKYVASTGGGGAGGGKIPPTITGGSGGGRPGAGGGGGNSGNGRGGRAAKTYHTFWGGTRTVEDDPEQGPFSLGNILKGDEGRGGKFGLPGFGSVGSLGGLGLEHWMLTGAGLGVSAGSAVGGAGLLGSAGLTKDVVGGGSDALVNKDTLSQISTYLSDVSALKTAIAEYGKNSMEATAAQGALNQSIAAMGGGQAGQAELGVAKNVENLKKSFNDASNGARAMSADIMNQGVQLAQDYVPLVTQAAQRNLSIVNTGLKPLFSWLEGPQGKGIFTSLENSFASTLPTAIHALDMGIEDFLRLMQAAAPYTGGLVTDLNNFFTSKNKEDAAQYDAEVQKLVGDLREWEGLLKLLAEDMGGVFKDDAGTANSIVGSLTNMLGELHDWEQSSTGQSQLTTVFAVHKQQILELLDVLPKLVSGYGSFYLNTAPPLVSAIGNIAKAFGDMAGAIEKIPGGNYLVGLMIVMSKLGVLGPSLRITAAAMNLMSAAEIKNAPVATKDALANKALGDSYGGSKTSTVRGLLGTTRGGVTTGEEAEEGAGIAGASGLLSRIPKLGSVFDRVASSGVGKGVTSGVEGAGLGAAGAAEGAGLTGLADSIAGASAAVAPLAAGLLPVLAAAGGVAGLIELFKVFSSNSASAQGQTVAQTVAHNLGIKQDQTGNLKQTVTAAYQAQDDAKARRQDTQFQQANPATQRFGPTSASVPTPNVSAAWSTAGKSAITSFMNTISAAKYPSSGLVWDQMETDLQGLPAKARGSAAQTMLEYASGLQQEGKIPAGSVKQMIGLVEGEFPALTSYLNSHGVDTQAAISNALSMTEAVSNTQSAVTNLKSIFGNMFDNAKVTSSNMLSEVTSDFTTLKANMGNLTGQGRQAALQQMAQLKETALSDASGMEESVSVKIGMMANKIQSGSASAATFATSNFQTLANNIAAAMSSGELATTKGVTLIGEALNQTLKALGAKTIPLTALKADSVSELLGEAHYLVAGGTGNGAGAAPGMKATGGLIQVGQAGQAGHDTVPLRVAGASGAADIVVGAGEQLAVINRHQAPIINRALSREGYAGLPGLFNSVKTLNYMAGGGLVPGFAGGGQITAPTATGGTMAVIVNAALNMDATAANTVLGKDTAAANAAAGGAATSGSTAGLSGTLVQMVRQLATQFGWNGAQVQDWLNVINVESGGSMTATNPESGAYGIAQMNTGGGVGPAKAKYYQYGGNPNTMAGQLLAMANYIKDTYVDPANAWESELTRHAYAGGGLLPMLMAAGGTTGSKSSLTQREQQFVADAKTKGKKTAPKPKKTKGLRGVPSSSWMATGKKVGTGTPFPFNTDDYGAIQTALQNILNLDGTDAGTGSQGGAAATLQDLISDYTNVWESSLYPTPNFSSWDSPSDFVLSSTDSAGTTTYSISPNIDQVSTELGQIIGYQTGVVGDLTAAYNDSVALATGDKSPIQTAINRRVTEIAKIRAYVKTNVENIKALKKKIATAQAQVKIAKLKIKALNGKVTAAQKDIKTWQKKPLPHPKPKNQSERNANAAFLKKQQAAITADQDQISRLNTELAFWNADVTSGNASIASWTSTEKGLESTNSQLVGSPDTLPSNASAGVNSELGQLFAQVGSQATGTGAIATALGTGSAGTGLYGLLSTVQGWASGLAPGNPSGDIAAQALLLQEYQAGLAGLLPGANSALATSLADATTSTASTESVTGSTGFSFQGQEYVASLLGMPGMAGGGLLGGGMPFAGSFWTGTSRVPGAIGQPWLAEVHGGEIIHNPNLPTSQGTGVGSGLAQAMGSLESTLQEHQRGLSGALRSHEQSIRQNTAAMSSSTSGGRVQYRSIDARAYDPKTSSRSLINAAVGL